MTEELIHHLKFEPNLNETIIESDWVNISKDRSLLENFIKSSINDKIIIIDIKKIQNFETGFNEFKYVLSKESLTYYDLIKNSIEKKFGNTRFSCEESLEYIPYSIEKNSSLKYTSKTVVIIRKSFLKLPPYYQFRIIFVIFLFIFIIYIIFLIYKTIMYS